MYLVGVYVSITWASFWITFYYTPVYMYQFAPFMICLQKRNTYPFSHQKVNFSFLLYTVLLVSIKKNFVNSFYFCLMTSKRRPFCNYTLLILLWANKIKKLKPFWNLFLILPLPLPLPLHILCMRKKIMSQTKPMIIKSLSLIERKLQNNLSIFFLAAFLTDQRELFHSTIAWGNLSIFFLIYLNDITLSTRYFRVPIKLFCLLVFLFWEEKKHKPLCQVLWKKRRSLLELDW